MERGELYRVGTTPPADPRRFRIYCVVSRAALIRSTYQTLICAPVYSSRLGLETEVLIGESEGLRHASALRCDELTSVPRSELRAFVGRLSPARLTELDLALATALDLRR